MSAQHGVGCGLQLLRSREPGGALELLGARELYALRGAAPATSTEAGGKLHVCATQPGAHTVGVQLVRRLEQGVREGEPRALRMWRRPPLRIAMCA